MRKSKLTWQRESSTGLLVLVVFVFLKLRNETKLTTPTALRKVHQWTLKTDRETGTVGHGCVEL